MRRLKAGTSTARAKNTSQGSRACAGKTRAQSPAAVVFVLCAPPSAGAQSAVSRSQKGEPIAHAGRGDAVVFSQHDGACFARSHSVLTRPLLLIGLTCAARKISYRGGQKIWACRYPAPPAARLGLPPPTTPTPGRPIAGRPAGRSGAVSGAGASVPQGGRMAPGSGRTPGAGVHRID